MRSWLHVCWSVLWVADSGKSAKVLCGRRPQRATPIYQLIVSLPGPEKLAGASPHVGISEKTCFDSYGISQSSLILALPLHTARQGPTLSARTVCSAAAPEVGGGARVPVGFTCNM